MRRWLFCLLMSVLAAAVGPAVIAPTGRSAGTPFAYEPPEGFVPAKDPKAEEQGARVWVHEPEPGAPLADRGAGAARITLTHSTKEMSVEEVELAKLASEMPAAFEGLCTWVHRRHEMRVRADGARVGLIEGDCNREIDLRAFGLPSTPIKSRKLQMMFPDDGGTSIVTASYPTDQATRWEPLLEATIARARGVAVRVPAPPSWMRLAWGAAGALVAWLAAALFARRDAGRPPPPEPAEGDA